MFNRKFVTIDSEPKYFDDDVQNVFSKLTGRQQESWQTVGYQAFHISTALGDRIIATFSYLED